MGWYIVIQDWMRGIGLSGNDLLVYAAIHGYSQNADGCYYGTRSELAARCGINLRTLDRILQKLMKAGLIERQPIARGSAMSFTYSVTERGRQNVYPSDKMSTPSTNLRRGDKMSQVDNGGEYNTTVLSSPPKRAARASAREARPSSVEEVKAYAEQMGYDLDAEAFWSHYASNGWKVGKNPMKDWRAAVTNWVKRDRTDFRRQAPPPQQPAKTYETIKPYCR